MEPVSALLLPSSSTTKRGSNVAREVLAAPRRACAVLRSLQRADFALWLNTNTAGGEATTQGTAGYCEARCNVAH